MNSQEEKNFSVQTANRPFKVTQELYALQFTQCIIIILDTTTMADKNVHNIKFGRHHFFSFKI